MKAVKNNKVYTITETTKKAYLSQGYDIVDDSGKIIEKAPTATVPYSVYMEAVAKNEALTKEVKKFKKANQ